MWALCVARLQLRTLSTKVGPRAPPVPPWQSMARNQYLSIWNDPKKGAATGQSDLPTGGTEEERLAALEKQVDQSLDALQKEVEGSIGSLATKLDALLAKAG